MKKVCPKCGFKANNKAQVISEFGLRKIKGNFRPQSYCKMCSKAAKRKTSKKKIAKKVKKLKAVEDTYINTPTTSTATEKPVEAPRFKPITFFETCDNERTGKILKIKVEELRYMLESLELSQAQEIGVDIREV